MKKKKRIDKGFKDKKEIIIVFLLLLIALILRLIYLSHLKTNDSSFYNPPAGTDMLTYDNYAKEILNGTFSKEPYSYGPLYFYFLALIYKIFGINAGIPRFIQMLIGLFTSFITYLIAKRGFNKIVGYVSLILSTIYPMFYIVEGVLLMESLVTFLNTLSVLLLLRIEDKPSYKNIAFAGVTLGLSALARANILLFIPFLLIWMFFNSKLLCDTSYSKIQNSKLLKFGFLCLIVLITISPATIRNYIGSGRFVLISTNGPVNLWMGNNPYATGEYKNPPSHYNDKVEERAKKEGDKAYTKEVISFIKENPKAFIKLLFKKFLLFWSNLEIDNNFNSSIQRRYSYILSLPIFINFGITSSLALTGIILSLSYFKRAFLLYIFTFSGMLSIVIMTILGRHRICFVPILIVFAGFALYWFYERIRKRESKRLILALIPLLFSLILVYSQSISGYFYPFVHPEGRHQEIENVIIIKDNGDCEKLSKDAFVLAKKEIKKELIITEDLQRFKEIVLLFSYQANTSGILTIDINGRIKGSCNMGGSGYLIQNGSIKLSPSLFNKGKNSIIISSEQSFLFPIDESITFKRSFFLKNGKWENLKKGEFTIWLELRR
ncbi:MAG: glycosyltransferase family 39 protein [bacterium]